MFRNYSAGLPDSQPQPDDVPTYAGPQMVVAILLMSCSIAGWSAFAWLNGHDAIAFACALTLLGAMPFFWLERTGRFRYARHVGYGIGLIGLAVIDMLIGADGHMDALYPGVVAFPFLLFNWRGERGSVILMCGLAMGSYVCTWAFGHNFVDPRLSHSDSMIYSLLAGVSGVAIVLTEMTVVTYVLFAKHDVMDRARQEAMVATQAKGHFLAAMSHEIRTPMNGVVGMVELLEATDMDDQQRRMLRTVRQSAFALLRIIDDILDVSKADAGQIELHPTRTDWLEFLESMTEAMGSYALRNQVRLVQFFKPGMPHNVTVDSGRLRQILVNLIGNAIKFTRREEGDDRPAIVEFTARLDDDGWILLKVSDNGIGIAEHQLDSIFDPFAQASGHGSARFGGTGLGLTITKRLVEKMGGEISVESTLGQGATFTVRLPMAEREGEITPPDLSGVTVILRMDAAGTRLDDGVYVRSTGATLMEAPTEERLFELAAEHPEAVFLIGPRQAGLDVDDAAVLRFQQAFPTAHCVTFSARPSDRYGMISPTTVRVHWGPMRLSELWAGMAAAAGRSLPNASVALADTVVSALDRAEDLPPVLLVEDNEINREVLGQQLKRIGLQVVTAVNGAEGLQYWREGNFPLVLTDCHMPLMDGFEMTTRIREIEEREGRPRTAIVAITANTLAGEAQRCLSHGMDDYLSKPVRVATLREAVLRWAGGADEADVLGAAPMEIRLPD